MTVFIEYAFIDNFIIDYLIFKTTFKIAKKKVSVARILICSLIGAVFAVLYPLITANNFIITVVKIIFGLFLTFIAGKFNGIKDYINFTAVFLGVTFLLGGTLIGVYSILGINGSSEFSVALAFVPVYLIIYPVNKVIAYIFRKKDLSSFIAEVTVFFDGKSVTLCGFFDTGNNLYDGVNPVIVASKKAILPLISPKLIKTAKKISVKTVNGVSEKISFVPDKTVIYYGDKRNIFNNVTVCLTDENTGEYQVILHPSLIPTIKGEYYKNENCIDGENKKVS